MNNQELYKSRKKRIKLLRKLTPIIFWSFLLIAITLISMAIIESLGNFKEMTSLLNSRIYTGEELLQNYEYLIEKYGEWVIGNGSKGFQINFIQISNVLFSNKVVFYTIFSIILFLNAFLWGKWLLPYITKNLEIENQDLTNLTVLKLGEKFNVKEN